MFDPEQPLVQPAPVPTFVIRRYRDPQAPLRWPVPNVPLSTRDEVLIWVAEPHGSAQYKVPPAEHRRRYFHDYPLHVRRLPMWDWMCTLTFNRRVGRAVAFNCFEQWLGQLAPNDHLDALVTLEKKTDGRWHVHALLLFYPRAHQPRIRAADRLWFNLRPETGYAKIKHFDPSRRGAWYVDKHGDAAVFVHCPRPPSCRRKRGCTEKYGGIWYSDPSS